MKCTSDDFQGQKVLDLRQSPKKTAHLFRLRSELLHFEKNFEEHRLTKCMLIEETTFKSKDDGILLCDWFPCSQGTSRDVLRTNLQPDD